MSNRSYLGLADCFLAPYAAAGPARFLGSLSQLQLQYDEEAKEQKNYGREGGLLDATSRINKIGGTAVFQSVSKQNLALAMRASTADVASGTVSDEPHAAHLDALIRTAHPNPTDVVVTDDAGTTTFDPGTDYRVTGAGVVPLAGGTITEGQAVKVSYSYGAYERVEALTDSQRDYTLHFDGLNEAEGGANTTVDLWRMRFGAVQSFDLIGDEYANLQLSFFLLRDPNQTGTGVSKFFRWLYPAAA